MNKIGRVLVSWMVAAALPLAAGAQAPAKPPAAPEQEKPKAAPVKPAVKPRGDAPKGLPPSGVIPLMPLPPLDSPDLEELKWKLDKMKFDFTPLLPEFDKAAMDEMKWKLQDMDLKFKDFKYEIPLLPEIEIDKFAFDDLKWKLDDHKFDLVMPPGQFEAPLLPGMKHFDDLRWNYEDLKSEYRFFEPGKDWNTIAQAQAPPGVVWQNKADAAQTQADRQRQEEARQRQIEARQRALERAERWEELYAMGTESMHEQRWQRAVDAFNRVASSEHRRSDGALYWKAYSLNKLGRRDDALAALRELQQKHPNSRWLKDAKTLEVEAGGKAPNPEAAVDDSIFVLALSNLMMNAPDRALPIAERELRGNRPRRTQERILFILAQSAYPASRDLLARVARGEFNPDLQARAVRYLGAHGGRDNQQFLYDLYAGSNDTDVKVSVLRSLTNSGRHDLVYQIAQNEANPDMRRAAIRYLANMGRRNELWTIYQKETDDDVREYLLQMFGNAGDAERLAEVARSAKDARLRIRAIRSLGNMGPSTSDLLVGFYRSESDTNVKKMIISSLHNQGNAKALVTLARAETNDDLKKELIRRLSTMRSKEATDYMMEILNK